MRALHSSALEFTSLTVQSKCLIRAASTLPSHFTCYIYLTFSSGCCYTCVYYCLLHSPTACQLRSTTANSWGLFDALTHSTESPENWRS